MATSSSRLFSATKHSRKQADIGTITALNPNGVEHQYGSIIDLADPETGSRVFLRVEHKPHASLADLGDRDLDVFRSLEPIMEPIARYPHGSYCTKVKQAYAVKIGGELDTSSAFGLKTLDVSKFTKRIISEQYKLFLREMRQQAAIASMRQSKERQLEIQTEFQQLLQQKKSQIKIVQTINEKSYAATLAGAHFLEVDRSNPREMVMKIKADVIAGSGQHELANKAKATLLAIGVTPEGFLNAHEQAIEKTLELAEKEVYGLQAFGDSKAKHYMHNEKVVVVMDWHKGKELFAAINAHELNAQQCNQIALQIGKKIADCHKKGIILCDLKTENCIVSIDADGNANATIIDAGGFYKAGEFEHGTCFTPEYLDNKNLEAARTGGINAITPNKAIDAYAFGILLCDLYAPLLGLEYDKTIAINQYQWPAEVPNTLKPLQNIIQGLTIQDESARMRVEDALPRLGVIQPLIEAAADRQRSSISGAGAGAGAATSVSTSPEPDSISPITHPSTSVSPATVGDENRSPVDPSRKLSGNSTTLIKPKGQPAIASSLGEQLSSAIRPSGK